MTVQKMGPRTVRELRERCRILAAAADWPDWLGALADQCQEAADDGYDRRAGEVLAAVELVELATGRRTRAGDRCRRVLARVARDGAAGVGPGCRRAPAGGAA